MNQDSSRKKREPRVSRAFMVRINEEVSAQKPIWNIVMAQNLSASGILFNFDHYIEPGTQLQFKIALPSGTDVECDGEVVRNVMGTSRGHGDPEQPVCAIAALLKNMESEDRRVVHEFVEQYLIEQGTAKRPGFSPGQRPGTEQRAKRIDRSYITRICKEKNGEWELVAVHNISESGILFNCGKELEIGCKLSLSIMLPFSEIPVICQGEVVRVKDETRPAATIKTYATGVAFSGLDEAIRNGLREYGEQIGRD